MSELEQFRDEVRTFLSEKLTPELQRAGRLEAGIYADLPIAEEWLAILNEQGWAVPDWPVEWGGTGWSAEQHAVLMVAPAIMHYASEEQKNYYLPRMRNGQDWWAQGYSEPGAGSDLSSLKCAAVRDGDQYIINGTKIWTTHAQFCNKMFCLVRTDSSGPQQRGITFLLFDLDLPGIEVKPIISISGDHELNQVFFTDARVPVTGRLGEENDGWSVAKYLLTHERGGKSATGMTMKVENLRGYLADAAEQGFDLREDADYMRQMAAYEVELESYVAFEERVFASVAAGESIGTVSSVLKIRRAEMLQQMDELVIEAIGYYGLPYQPEIREFRNSGTPVGSETAATAMPRYLNNRAATIYGGSNEVQRNILAKRTLGL